MLPRRRLDPSTFHSTLRKTSLLVVPSLVVDGFLIFGYVIHALNDGDHVFSGRGWDGNRDGSHGELFGHAQLIFAILALLVIWRVRRTTVYGAWALVLGAVVADDFLRLHERGGAALARALEPPAVAGLRRQDLGELGVWAAATLILGSVLLVAHMRAPGAAKRNSRTLIALMLALVAFAVVVDVLHIMVGQSIPREAGRAMTLTETSGELGVMTLMMLAVHRMLPAPGHASDVGASDRIQ